MDVAVVGSGPAGLMAATYVARGNRETVVFGDVYDSQMANAGTYENFPGFPDGVTTLDLAEDLLAQAERYGAENVPERVDGIQNSGDGFTLDVEDELLFARTVILATGATPRPLGVDGEERLKGRGVSYCPYCDGPEHRGEEVAVVGYGNGAANAVLQLKEIASRVYLLCLLDELRSEKVYLDRIGEAGNVAEFYRVEPSAISGREAVESIEFEQGGESKSLSVSGVFVERGTAPESELAECLGAATDDEGYVEVTRPEMETSVRGLFAAGDVTGGRKQAATAVGEGSNAAISALIHLGD